MFQIKKAGEKTYYIDFPTRVGIYKTGENSVCLIDTGSDEKIGARILKLCEAEGFKITAIFNTHCHADHTGGNAIIQQKTGCKVYCPDIDLGAVRHTILNQIMLSGCYPLKELDRRMYLADSCSAEALTPTVLPEGLEVINLKGHTMGMVGFKTSDNIYFLADSVVAPEAIMKYPATYLISVYDYLETLDYLDTLDGSLYLPSHVAATENIKELVEINRKSVYEVIDTLIEYCKKPRSYEDIIDYYFSSSCLPFNVAQYSLIGSTLRSYVSCLQRKGLLELQCIGNRVYIKSTENTI